MGPDEPVAVDEADVRCGRFADGGIRVGEQHVVEAVALRDAPVPKRTEQPDVLDVRHIATAESGSGSMRFDEFGE